MWLWQMFMKYIIYFKVIFLKKFQINALKTNLIKLMKILVPFTPHIAYECLEMLGTKEIKTWPKVDTKLIQAGKN